MKKISFILLVLTTITFAFVSVSHSDQWTITQIKDDPADEGGPKINNNGHIVWWGNDGNDSEIFLDDGTTITQLTDNVYNDWNPVISNNGNVAWTGSDGNDYEIFLYNGTTTTQITDNSYDDESLSINDHGHLVWTGWDGNDWEIFLYDGTTTTQLTDNSYDDLNPQLNNNGYVVWQGGDGNDYEIFLYDGITITQITNNTSEDANPKINDHGYVVWHGHDGNDYEIFLYNGKTTTQITFNSGDDIRPSINNKDEVVWQGNIGSDPRTFFYDGTTITNIVWWWSEWPSINDNSHVVWQAFGWNGWGIFLATPPAVVTVTSPNGGEAIPSGAIHTIKYETPENAASCDLMYSVDNKTTWNTMAKRYTGRSFSWRVPVYLSNKTKCYLKVKAFDSKGLLLSSDDSDGPFTIEGLKLLSPNGEETFHTGDSYPIRWATYGTMKPVAKVVLMYTINNGTTWKNMTTLTGNPTSYSWTVPLITGVKMNCKVKVILRDARGNTLGTDVSDEVFTISQTLITP